MVALFVIAYLFADFFFLCINLSNYCVICDREHMFSSGLLLKSAVCHRELCRWAYQTLGVMADVADEFGTQVEVLVVCYIFVI